MNFFKQLSIPVCAVISLLMIMIFFPAEKVFARGDYSIYIINPCVGYKASYKITNKNSDNIQISTASSQYMKNGIIWFDVTDGSDTPMDPEKSVFEKDHTYKVRVFFDTSESPVYVMINGNGYKKATETTSYMVAYGKYYAEQTLEALTPIDKVEVGVDTPIVGQPFNYVLDIAEDAPYSQAMYDYNSEYDHYNVRWCEKDVSANHAVRWKTEVAVEKNQYMIQVLYIKPKAGYLFTNDTEIVFTNKDYSVTKKGLLDGGERLYFDSSYANVITPEDLYEKIISVNGTLKEPAIGNLPDYDIQIPSNAGYVCENFDLKWFDITSGADVAMNPATGKFEKNHQYRVDINLKAKEGYCFPETGITASVNSKTAALSRTDGYNAVLSQTFDLSVKPTVKPTAKPTATPAATAKPTAKPSKPTATPTSKPTVKPTAKPSKPTATPTSKPTVKPTNKPSKPTATPTVKPTAKPTTKPTAKPTKASAVSLTLDKSNASVVCGNKLTLKATLKGSSTKITWKSSDPKVATVDSSGKVTAKMAGAATISASAAGKSTTCSVTVLYKDVTDSKDFWFAPTNYLTAACVVKGYDKQTLFKPANMCTRAQMVTFIWRLQGEPEPKTKTCKFSDVKSKDYFYKACIWGNENHIVEGYKDGTFGPQIVCARKHAVTFLWRLANKPSPKSKENKIKDVKKGDYFYTATLWASEKGILAGYKDGTFRPDGDCLRRQMVTFLYKYDKFVNKKG